MKNRLLAFMVAMALSGNVLAEDTSSSLRGKITDPQGNAAANTTITIVHVPSGTKKTIHANSSGNYSATGLRVGGPYKVIIDSDKFVDQELANIYLQLGKVKRLSVELESEANTMVITGARVIQEAGGSSSVFGAEAIINAVSFNRDIKDIARLNPLATINGKGELVIAGGNPRSNSFTVDGIGQNDDFGLNRGGYPTQQPPISLDAIEQISVDVSPFSAKKGNFGGGIINAVTKSGSNKFEFSSFAETSAPSMTGDSIRIDTVLGDYARNLLDENGHRTYEDIKVPSIETVERFGFSVGGSIIEDKLFYFLNYTDWSSTLSMDYGFDGSGATHEYDITEDQFNTFNRILNDVYGMTDSFGGNPEDTNQTLLFKLSWNINSDHRGDFTYQWQDDHDAREFGTGGSNVSLASRRYDYVTKLNNFAAKVYSNWNSQLSTEIGVSVKDVETNSITNSNIGQVDVNAFFRGPSFSFGTEQFRHANESANKNITISFDGTYLMGEHEIRFGISHEDLNLYNLFANDSKGVWEFANFDDFENQTLGNFGSFEYSNAFTGNVRDNAYDLSRKQISLYVEDNFDLTSDIAVTAGVRYERLSASEKPAFNQGFFDTYGYSNQENLDGLDIILPRINLNWSLSDELVIRGGIGRFQGGIPNVWYNNPFQVDGLTFVAASENAIDDHYDNNPVDSNFEVPQSIIDSLTQGAGSINYTDPNFKLPSSWRSSIAVDYSFDIPSLGNDFKLSTELMYHVKENEAVWTNTALVQNRLVADGERVIYDTRYTGDLADNFDIQMTNAAEDGRSIIFSTSLAKSWDNGINMMMSYAHQDITENQVGGSSRAQSNYQHNVIKSRNLDFVARGHYEIEHSFKLNLGYSAELFSGYETNVNLFLERRSGRPFSWTMGMFRDGDLGDVRAFNSSSAYLAYIPTGPNDPNVNWDESEMSWSELEVFLNQAGISERGQILDRNTASQPWVTTMDLSIKQEIPGFLKGHKAQVFFLIDNFANLLNSDWGIERNNRFPNKAIYDFGGLDDQDRYIMDDRFGGEDTRNYDRINLGASAWRIKVGVNYKF